MPAFATLALLAAAAQPAPAPGPLPPPAPPRILPAPPPAPPPPAFIPVPAERARPARPLHHYFSTDDYPAAALRAEEEGATAFTMTIGPDGRIANCTVTAPSGSAALDAATCRIVRSRVRYQPARDAKGAATWDTDIGRVRWRLPDEPTALAAPPDPARPKAARPPGAPVAPRSSNPPPPAPPPHERARPVRPLAALFDRRLDYPPARAGRAQGRVGFALGIGPDGRVRDCRITASSGSAALDGATCRILRARARYRPARDAAGNPLPDSDSGAFDWALPPG